MVPGGWQKKCGRIQLWLGAAEREAFWFARLEVCKRTAKNRVQDCGQLRAGFFFPSAARSPQQGKPLGRNRHGATGGGARPRQSCGRPRATSSPRVPSFQGRRAQFQAETFNIDLDHTTQPPTAPLRLVYFYAPLLLGSISQLHCRIGSPLDAMKRIVGPSNPEGGAEEGSSISTPEQPSQNPETPDTPGTMGAKRTFLPPELVSILTPSLQVGTGVGMSNPPCPLLWRQTRS